MSDSSMEGRLEAEITRFACNNTKIHQDFTFAMRGKLTYFTVTFWSRSHSTYATKRLKLDLLTPCTGWPVSGEKNPLKFWKVLENET